MGKFSHVLLAVDYDRTLTDCNSRIPQVNLDAIRTFMEQGGAFTVATGRSVPMFRSCHQSIPVNAPFILYNGAAFYDYATESLLHAVPIPDGEQILRQLLADFPFLWTEIQGIDYHYLFGECPMRDEFYRYNKAAACHISLNELPSPLLKFAMYGNFVAPTVASLFEDLPEEVEQIDRVTQQLQCSYSDVLVIDRAAPRIIDIQAKSVNKGAAARTLAQQLGREVLVCAGDALNDISMLEQADLAYVPSDCAPAVAARGYRQVCACKDGAVADLLRRLDADLLSLKKA